MTDKKPRTFLTAQEKQQAVRACQDADDQGVRACAAFYGVGYSTLSGWRKIARESGIEAVGVKNPRRKYKRRPKAPTSQPPATPKAAVVESETACLRLLGEAYQEIANLRMELARRCRP